MTAIWNQPVGQSVELYTLSCSINSREVLSVTTAETTIELGIYEPNTTYVCHVRYSTTSGVGGGVTSNQSLTTGGDFKMF